VDIEIKFHEVVERTLGWWVPDGTDTQAIKEAVEKAVRLNATGDLMDLHWTATDGRFGGSVAATAPPLRERS
jgi:hypothetical protein